MRSRESPAEALSGLSGSGFPGAGEYHLARIDATGEFCHAPVGCRAPGLITCAAPRGLGELSDFFKERRL